MEFRQIWRLGRLYRQIIFSPCPAYKMQMRTYSTQLARTPRIIKTSCAPRPWSGHLTQRFLNSRSESQVLTDRPDTLPESEQKNKKTVEGYILTFTCKPCLTRSTHQISKQGYHHGTVLITCPNCKNKHVISDHCQIFSDKSVTIEDILREKGEAMKKGTISADGHLEFWGDSNTEQQTREAQSS